MSVAGIGRSVRPAPRLGLALPLIVTVALGAALPLVSPAQSPTEDDFVYRAQDHDTLIGIGRRLLREPERWPALQRRNRIANPRRIPVGTAIGIPYGWLKWSPETARVQAVSGSAHQAGTNLGPGQELGEGSLVETGADGSATLALADGSFVTLQKSTTVELAQMQHVSGLPTAHDIRLKLRDGRLESAVKPHGDSGRFEIASPVAISAVRGTQFRSSYDPASGAAADETLEGAVAVGSADGAAAARSDVAIPAGFGTKVERGAAPLPPVKLLPAPDLTGLPSTNHSARLQLHWPELTGAHAWRFQLAADSAFQQIFLDAKTPGAQLDQPAPPDGVYWVRVRAIDELGLEGLDAVKQLTEHQLPAPPTPDTPVSASTLAECPGTLSWHRAPDVPGTRLEVARDAAFSDIVLHRDVDAAGIERGDLAPGHYYWRVAGRNAQGETGEWSAVPECVIRLPAPTPDVTVAADRTVTLRWTEQLGMRYRVEIAYDPDFTRPALEQDVGVAQFSTQALRPAFYYARVLTLDGGGGTGAAGPAREFHVPLPLWVRLAIPVGLVLALIH